MKHVIGLTKNKEAERLVKLAEELAGCRMLAEDLFFETKNKEYNVLLHSIAEERGKAIELAKNLGVKWLWSSNMEENGTGLLLAYYDGEELTGQKILDDKVKA